MYSMMSWFLLIWIQTLTNGQVTPTITNATGEYYITSISGSFASNTITCTSSICNIICDAPSNCSDITIHASLSTTLNFECSKYRSCYSATIASGPSNTLNMKCLQEQSCMNGDFTAQYTSNIDIECNYYKCANGCNSGQSSCGSSTFNLEYTNTVKINCAQHYDCYFTTFNVNHSSTALFSAGNQGLYKSIIIATGVNYPLTIDCTSSFSCRSSTIYAPANVALNLNCMAGYSCESNNIYITTETNQNLNLACSATTTSCDQVTLYCQDTGLSTNYLYSESESAFICQTNDCCPSAYESGTNTLDCAVLFGVGLPCNIDCSNYTGCPFKTIIDGSQASSLTVTCDDNYECQHLDIKCPNGGNCDANCLSLYSCEYIKFLPETVASVNLLCSGSHSCDYVNMELTVTNYVNISCMFSYSCYYANLIIYGVEGVTDISFLALSDRSFFGGQLLVTKGNTLSIGCYPANYVGFSYTCYNLNAVISKLNSINIVCEGEYGCYHSDWDLKADDINVLCNGYWSCRYISMIANVTNLLSMNTNNATAYQNGVIRGYCMDGLNVYNCMENITLYCGSNATPYPIGADDQCRNCMYNGGTNYQQYISYSSSYIWQNCMPTPKPTTSPSTTSPSPAPTIQLTLRPTNNPTELTVGPTANTPSPTLDTASPTAITSGPTSNTVSPTSDTASPTTVTPGPTLITASPSRDPTYSPSTDPSQAPTIEPTTTPSVNPTAAPTNITLVPSTNPSKSPTSAPTKNAGEYVPSTTDEIQIHRFGVVITIIFKYTVNRNNTPNATLYEVKRILQNIIDTKVNKLFADNDDTYCIYDDYGITIFPLNDDKTLINATILVCDEELQTKLSVEFDDNLATDFVDNVKNKTTIDIEVEVIDINKVDITTTTQQPNESKSLLFGILDMDMLIYIVVGMTLLIIILLCIVVLLCCRKNRKKIVEKSEGTGYASHHIQLGSMTPNSTNPPFTPSTDSPLPNITHSMQRVWSASGSVLSGNNSPILMSRVETNVNGEGLDIHNPITAWNNDDDQMDEELYATDAEMIINAMDNDNVITAGGPNDDVISYMNDNAMSDNDDAMSDNNDNDDDAKTDQETVNDASVPTPIALEFKTCFQCNQQKSTKQGSVDQNDGNWYCHNCWNEFYQ